MPCDLDLASARDREEAEGLYAEQAGALRDALAAADTVLAIWREPLEDLVRTRVDVDRRIVLDVRLPAHRLLPAALVAPEKQIVVTAVCGARPLAEGRPPMGIVCAQQDVARVYPLPDDPERCLEDFLEQAAEHARRAGERLAQQEASVERFLELSGDDFPESRLVPCRGRAPRHARSPPSPSASFVFLGISFLLARALTGPGAERSRVLDVVRARGARRRRRGARAAARLRARAGLRARHPRARRRARAARRGRDPHLPPVGARDDDAPLGHRPRRLARRRARCRSSSASRPGARGR